MDRVDLPLPQEEEEEEEEAAFVPESSTTPAVAQISPSNDATIISTAPSASVSDDAAGEDVLLKARNLMRRITAARLSPHPRFLHNLAAIMEQEEDRFQQETGYLSSNNTRSSHTIGRLASLIQENDGFFELLSSKLLVDARHSLSVQAAAARLLLSCLTCGTFPDVFQEEVLGNIKQWVTEDHPKLSDSVCPKKSKNVGMAKEKKFEYGDWEMLKTYSIGLLASALAAGGGVVEDLLASGVAGKLMHYLRITVLKDNTIQKDSVHLSIENRLCSSATSIKIKEDGRSRVRFPLEVPGEGNLMEREQSLSDEVEVVNGMTRLLNGQITGEASCEQDLPKGPRVTQEIFTDNAVCPYDADSDTDWLSDEKKRKKEWKEGQSREGDWNSGRFSGKDEMEETGREDFSKCGDGFDKGNLKMKGKTKVTDGFVEDEKIFNSPSSDILIGYRQENSGGFRCDSENMTGAETKRGSSKRATYKDVEFLDGERKTEQREHRSMVGDLDIFASVQKAAEAAESEAKAAKAPIAAVKAAREAAVELVRVAAMESLSSSNDKETALAAAAAAAKTVVDAAIATQALMNDLGDSNIAANNMNIMTTLEMNVHDYTDLGDCVLDKDSLAKLREKFSVQCLEKMGEYLEVLGPVLHERGVDVCLAFLVRESGNHTSSVKDKSILPDILRLICAFSAHRKFAALFVDKAGLQQLLAVPRNPQTYPGISLCLFAFASLQMIMERVCALPANVVNTLVNLALNLLECTQESARRNAALFFGAAFVFRVIIDSFDAQDGLSIMLNLLRNAAALRSGRGSGPSGSSSTTGSRSDRVASTEVLTSSEKQIAYHTCIALRQYFRAHLSILVDFLRPCKGRSGSRSGRASYRPLDLSNEAIENVVLQLQRDRKLGPAFVRARWPALEKFMNFNGHLVLLELVQVAPGERYLYESAQHALGILQLVTLMPFTRRYIVGCSLSNGRSGMSVILDAASIAGFADAEVIQPALLVLVNLVCPPPSVCSRPISQQGDAVADIKSGGERTGGVSFGQPLPSIQSPASGLVGDKRIFLGSGAGGSGLAAHMEQGYRQAREAVRANNGIKVLLHLLYPKTVLPPPSLDCIHALACRVLLGLARDDAIAHILTKLQVGKVLSELLRDGSSHAGCSAGVNCMNRDHGRWQAELGRVAMELIAIVTNAGRASALVTSDAAAPTLRRIERAAIAAATPISYHPRELLQLIHEHLAASGFSMTAEVLLKEAQLTPLSPLLTSLKIPNQFFPMDSHIEHQHWPTGQVRGGFMAKSQSSNGDDTGNKIDHIQGSVRKRCPTFATSLIPSNKTPQLTPLTVKRTLAAKDTAKDTVHDHQVLTTPRSCSVEATKRKALDKDMSLFPSVKRLAVSEFAGSSSAFVTPVRLKSSLLVENVCSLAGGSFPGHQCESPKQVPGQSTLVPTSEKLDNTAMQNFDNSVETHLHDLDHPHASVLGYGCLQLESQSLHNERATLDSLVVQYLKHQHRQCPAPITTLPPISLFHPHVCPDPNRVRYAPLNTGSRLAMREIFPPHGGTQGHKRDRHFVYSRFRPWRTCREEGVLLTCTTFLSGAFRVAAGSHGGDICIFDCNSGNLIETHVCHQSPISLLQASPVDLAHDIECIGSHPGQLLLSSCSNDVRIWNSLALGEGPIHSFEGCRSARFNHGGHKFAAISSESSQREVLIYDVQSSKLDNRLSDNLISTGPLRGHGLYTVHFNPADTLLLWNGVLWDYRIPRSVHKFDQFTDYGGGGFHPAGNEVIINSEVWDLRSFKLLRSVPSLDQTVITFSGTGDIIYATLRRNAEDIMSAFHHRRSRHPLFAAFRTMDAVDYTDIAMTPVDRCVLDLATESSNSLISVVAMDSTDEMDSFVKLYEVGRRRPTEDDSDPDDGLETEDEDTEIDEAAEDMPDDGDDSDLDGSNDDNDASGDGDEAEQEDDADLDSNDDDDDDDDDNGDDDVIGVGEGILEIVTEGEEDETGISYSSDDDDDDDDDMSSGDFDENFNNVLHRFF